MPPAFQTPRNAAAAPRQHYLRSIRLAFGEAWHTADVRTVILLAGTVIAALDILVSLGQLIGGRALFEDHRSERGLQVLIRELHCQGGRGSKNERRGRQCRVKGTEGAKHGGRFLIC